MKSELLRTPALAAAVQAAVKKDGHTWKTIDEADGPSPASMTNIVKGDMEPISEHLCKKLDQVLNWPKGTARRLADPNKEPDVRQPKPTIQQVVDGRVVDVDRPDLLELHARAKQWLDDGREILDLLDQTVDRRDVGRSM